MPSLPIQTIDFYTGVRIEYITFEELELICNGLWSRYRVLQHRKKGKKFLRDCFIFSFLFFTGARLTEFLLSQKFCVDLEEKTYYVPQLKKRYWKKFPDDPYIDPYERFENGLIKYVEVPIDHTPEKHLKYWEEWLNTRKDEDFLVDIKERQVRNIIYRYSKETLGRRISPHALRHSTGVYLTNDLGLPVQDVQRVMRHTNGDVTFRYVRLKSPDLKQKLKQAKTKLEE
ncbi:site-specific integrase [Methanocaldococcus sp.]|uniref:site-specific integrase n=1 Tax=Methanocaldococcus sp. TaxID=2152917 RepID=UPI002628BD3D|nr:site-specific integrase [Methanocaldococcus sp.]MCQ6254754.1 site-specific integrase [Methanocaldococcus sp.]